MSSEHLQQELQRIAQVRFAVGVLPRCSPRATYAGFGDGKHCSLCNRKIPQQEVEYEVECDPGEGKQALLRFHVLCHEIWQDECSKRTDEGL
jgi:hypothetical protein